MMETIKKIDDGNLEITKPSEEVKRILPKADIERNIAELEKDLIYFKDLLNYFK